MDKTRINHQNQSYNIGKGQALVNLVTGRLLFEYPLLSIGTNNFQISTVLSYSSQYLPSDFGGKKIGLGNGWKLNFHQYLIPYYTSYNIDGFESGDYVYIDSSWCIHRFKLYTTGKYYDTSGTGLRLTISGTSKIIKDENDNSSIGIILCQSKNNEIVDYTLKYINKPVGVSEYKIFNELPNNLLESLPSEDEISYYLDID